MSIEFYEEYIESNKAIIYKICRAYTHSKLEFDDYFQEVCLQLWKSKEAYNHQSKLSTWVYRVTLNTCLSIIKSEKREVDTVEINESFDHHSDLEDTEAQERLNTLYMGIRQLKKADRAIIVLYLEDKSYQEIAEIIGISMSNVGVKINRIKQQLKDSIVWKSLI
ncbi:sigma-70 family RNA polymerase sigma factor [Flammeovirga pectinis]|uniref:Sigma-70 family RNA polymerase sigma factor n=1 Tax=Flammeovirga pectinis TaxID=2494373 RepID=A0A3Q9FJN1_9BACT|nr:sigma-70 family RNA polymerase sigma factor [Flammeovirga pectinis]AZQ61271.1 sigma-70 family RNA polymerase sigma factor [Flammeovirga pectinis]